VKAGTGAESRSSDSSVFASAVELGRRMAEGELSPVEVAREHLDRIARLDPALRCYITVTPERALERARAAEKDLRAGRRRGPLHGVPFGLKDLVDTAGVRTTAGSRILADRVPARDAAVAERLEAAGGVLLGKHNLHEFAYGTTNANPHYGQCLNPWSPGHVPGGSSGGSAAALAAGLCALAVGTDTGGSIRIPVAACGVVGLKPTLGRVSRRGVFPLAWSLDHVGPMARTVTDAAALLGLLAGGDPEDPWCAARPTEDFGRDLEAGVEGLRLGTPRRGFGAGLEPDVERAVEEALAVLERLGARRVDVEIGPLEPAYTAFHGILASEAAALHGPWLRTRPEDYGEAVRQALEHGVFVSGADYVNARRTQARVREAVAAAFGRADVLVTPALPRTAPPVGESPSREPAVAWNRLLVPFNLAGVPAIAVPCGRDRRGLPIGLQIAGRAFDESTVLRVARAYERATQWHRLRPPEPGPLGPGGFGA
jgi:aspartyl-tRNA(Asn)/glutamyl-tRNA(Gln) amidotransferase subunit A